MGIGKLEYQMVYIFCFFWRHYIFDIKISYFINSKYGTWEKFAFKYYKNTIATKSVIYVMVITYDLLPIVDRKLKDQQQLYDFTIYDLEMLRYR